jgi:flagellar hook-associated protein 1
MASSLAGILNIGSEALHNSRVGVDVTGHNIANAHSTGYSRQRVELEAKEPALDGIHVKGMGARVQQIGRVHDSFIENSLRKETQAQGFAEGLSSGLSRMESLFSPELTNTVRDRMGSFLNSLRELSSYPEEQSVRQHVIESASAFTSSMNETHGNIIEVQENLTNEAEHSLDVANEKLKEVAILNVAIMEMEVDKASSANDLRDKRDTLIRELSELVDTRVYVNEHEQLTIRGPDDVLLLEGARAGSFSMETDNSEGNLRKIYIKDFEGNRFRDVTDKMTQGSASGLIVARDKQGEIIRNSLNEMAKTFGEKMNEIHRQGYGINEYQDQSGRDFFEGLNDREPAQTIKISVQLAKEPQAISAAMTPGAAGDNVIANKIVSLFQESVVPGLNKKESETKLTFAGFYDEFVGKLGVDSLHAQENKKASDVIVAQVKAQRQAISGVSLDEEAATLLKYQHLFTASSRIITTADEMFKTVLDLKR